MTRPALYPLLFKPILKSPLWGGSKLGTRLNKPIGDLDIIGESWEISGVTGNVSEVVNGDLAGKSLIEVIDEYQGNLLGEKAYRQFGNKFPLLIKFIDANQDLSIQVHPNDELARKRHNNFGKTEMWYVIDAEEGASLISGFNRALDQQEYLDYFNSGRITELLNEELVKNDDVFFLPAGRIHTIGKGLLIAEIQQTSDITYRIYDFDRVDKQGKKRELHVENALEAIDYNHYDDYKTKYDKESDYASLVRCKYFVTNRIVTEKAFLTDYRDIESFKIIMVLEGSGYIDLETEKYGYGIGDTYLIPACINSLTIVPENKTKVLEVYLPS